MRVVEEKYLSELKADFQSGIDRIDKLPPDMREHFKNLRRYWEGHIERIDQIPVIEVNERGEIEKET